MNTKRIAARLLSYLASGGTVDRAIADLPGLKPTIESTFEWMKSTGQCTAAEIEDRARRIGDLIRRKEEAIRGRDFDLGAQIRAEEVALAKTLGVRARGEDWRQGPDLDYQIRELAALIGETQASESGPETTPD